MEVDARHETAFLLKGCLLIVTQEGAGCCEFVGCEWRNGYRVWGRPLETAACGASSGRQGSLDFARNDGFQEYQIASSHLIEEILCAALVEGVQVRLPGFDNGTRIFAVLDGEHGVDAADERVSAIEVEVFGIEAADGGDELDAECGRVE
jgi:hypothetical protein